MMSKYFSTLLITGLLALNTSAARATLVVDDAVEPNTGWIAGGGGGFGNRFGLTLPIEGANLFNLASGAADSAKSFTGVQLAAGTYTTTFWVHNYENNPLPPPGLNAQLLGDNVSIDDLLTSSTTPLPAPDDWAQWTLVHEVSPGDARIGETLGFFITDVGGQGNGAFDSLDIDFVAAAAIPEPSTCVLMLIGLLGVAPLRRRRRR